VIDKPASTNKESHRQHKSELAGEGIFNLLLMFYLLLLVREDLLSQFVKLLESILIGYLHGSICHNYKSFITTASINNQLI